MAKGKRSQDAPDLDLVPIMNMVTILIPFLLMSAQFVTIAVIDSTLPAISADSAPTEDKPDKPPLNLSVAITSLGYRVLGSAGPLKANEGADANLIPCEPAGCPTPDSYDAVELTKLLAQVKDEYEEEENVILLPDSSTEYEVIIRTMDATRSDTENKDSDGKARSLFPNVVIAGGLDSK